MKLYDEDEAVKYILSYIGEDIPEDVILDIICLIFDYYEITGELDMDFDDEQPDEDCDIDSICSYVRENYEDSDISSLFIKKIVEAELDYETSLLD